MLRFFDTYQRTTAPSRPTVDQPRAAADVAEPFRSGSMLDELPGRDPDAAASCCETVMHWFGFDQPSITSLRRRYTELMSICRRLPASVNGCPALDRRLQSLHAEVAAFKTTVIGVRERRDELEHLNRLCSQADRLDRALEERERLMERRQQGHALSPQGAIAMATHPAAPPPRYGVSSDSDDLRDRDLSGLVQRRLFPRRRDLHREAEPVAQVQAQAAPVFEVDEAALRQAIDLALQDANGANRISGRTMLTLGRSVVAQVNGRFASRLPHTPELRARQYEIPAVIRAATQNMRPDQRDAIREAARVHLQGRLADA